MRILLFVLLLVPFFSFGQNETITYEYYNLTDRKLHVHVTQYDQDTTKFQSLSVLFPDTGHFGGYNSRVTFSIHFFRLDVIATDYANGDTIFSQTYILDSPNRENLKIKIQNGILEKSKTLYPVDRLKFSISGFDNSKDYHLILKTGDKLEIQFNGNETQKGMLVKYDSNAIVLIDKKGIKYTVKTDDIVGFRMRKYLLYFPRYSIIGHSKYYSVKTIKLVRQTLNQDKKDWSWE